MTNADDSGSYEDDTERCEGQVCPNEECHIDQRFPGFWGLACPECACRLVVACAKCDSGAVEEIDGSPRCSDHAHEIVADGGVEDGTEQTEMCQECGEEFNPDLEGYFVDTEDVGPDATGGTAEVFRQDAENFGEWSGFEEEDIGPWCDYCSWIIQRRRTRNNRSRDTGTDQDGGRR